jgi:hypothetical protein
LAYRRFTSRKPDASRVEVAYEALNIGNVESDRKCVESLELGALTPPYDIDGGRNYFVSERDEREHRPQSENCGVIYFETRKAAELYNSPGMLAITDDGFIMR